MKRYPIFCPFYRYILLLFLPLKFTPPIQFDIKLENPFSFSSIAFERRTIYRLSGKQTINKKIAFNNKVERRRSVKRHTLAYEYVLIKLRIHTHNTLVLQR